LAWSGRGGTQESGQSREGGRSEEDERAAEAQLQLCRMWSEAVRPSLSHLFARKFFPDREFPLSHRQPSVPLFGFPVYVLVFRDPDLPLFHRSSAPTSCLPVNHRNRNAIEDELEVLYDAYYEELEQYANYQQRYVSSGGTLPPPPGPGPFPGSVELDKNGAVVGHQKPQPPSHPNLRAKNPPATVVPNGRGPKAQVKHPESEFEDDQDEDEYEEEDDYEAEEDDEEDEDEDDGDGEGEGEDGDGRHARVTSRRGGAPVSTRRRTAADAKPERDKLFSFGSSLTVTGKSHFLSISVELSRLELVHLNLSRYR
jgi:hypothetical protein